MSLHRLPLLSLLSLSPLFLALPAGCRNTSRTDQAFLPSVTSLVATVTAEDVAVTIEIPAPQSNANVASLVFAVSVPPNSGEVEGTGSRFTYTPARDFFGSDRFQVSVSNGAVVVSAASVTIAVTPVNDAPVAVDDAFAASVNTPLILPDAALLANDHDVDSPQLTITSVADAVGGAVERSGATVVFTPTPRFGGDGRFSYTVSDGEATSTAMVTVAITAVNHPPVAVDDAATTDEDTPLTLRVADLLANDTDADGQTPMVLVVEDAVHGAVKFDGTNVVFTPTPDYAGPASFGYQISDGQAEARARVLVTVRPINDAPVAADGAARTSVDTSVAVALIATDVDSTSLTYAILTPPAHGTLSGAGAALTYTPAAHFQGTDAFTFQASDGLVASNTATIVLHVGADITCAAGPDPGGAVDRSIIPSQLEVPTLTDGEGHLLLIWHKPESYGDVVDYNVYMDGRLLGGAEANNARFSPAKAYIDGFYAADEARFHVRARIHNFTVDGLSPSSDHCFTARSVLTDGSESADSNFVAWRTGPLPAVLDVSAAPYRALGDGTTVNTAAIQAAIDNCPRNGKVLIPAGTFKTGALFLKSDMTLEIAEGATLLGSEKADDYPLARGYTLYDYLTDRRPPSLINAIDQGTHAVGTFQNIRIVGRGTLDGNGWLRTAAGSVVDEIGNPLPQYRASNSSKVGTDGILARDQVAKAVASGLALDVAYGNRRSSVITLRGVRNVYYEGFLVLNPAFHGIMNLETENVVVNSVVFETYDANNADGIEFGNSDGVVVLNSFFDTGDDCLNFAAGLGAAAATQPPSQNAWIFDNYYREGHGAVVAGSHTGAWIQHVLAEDNVMFHTAIGLRMKSTVQAGGGARDFVFRDSAMRDAGTNGFIFTLSYAQNNNVYVSSPIPAQFRDILVQNVTVDGGGSPAIQVDGFDPATALQNLEGYGDVYDDNIVFERVALNALKPTKIDHLENSTFRDVVFTNVVGGAPPWVVTNSPGLQYLGTTTPP